MFIKWSLWQGSVTAKQGQEDGGDFGGVCVCVGGGGAGGRMPEEPKHLK
jgi:hypothetical protein